MRKTTGTSTKSEGRFSKLLRRYIVHPLLLIIIIAAIGCIAWALSWAGKNILDGLMRLWDLIKKDWYMIAGTLVFAFLADLMMKPLLDRIFKKRRHSKADE